MKDFHSGDRVTARCSNGELRENVVWETGDKVVYLCSERQYSELLAGRDAPPPIGFLLRDIEEIANDGHQDKPAA